MIGTCRATSGPRRESVPAPQSKTANSSYWSAENQWPLWNDHPLVVARRLSIPRLNRTSNPGSAGTVPLCQVEGRALLRKEEGMAATVEAWAKEATLKRAPLASVRHAAVHRVHPRFSHSCTYGAVWRRVWRPAEPLYASRRYWQQVLPGWRFCFQ